MRGIHGGLLALCAALLSAAGTAAADDAERLIVRFRGDAGERLHSGSGSSLLEALSARAGVGLTLQRRAGGGLVVLRMERPLDGDAALEAARRIEAAPQVAQATPDRRVHPALVPNDPRYFQQWYLFEDAAGIRAQDAWDLERGAGSVTIAVLDTGILPHEDLAGGRILSGYDFISDVFTANDGDGRDPVAIDPGDAVVAGECGAGEPAADSSWHGLAVTGVLAADTGNATGIAGVNHQSRILPLRVLGRCGGDLADILDAMRWAAGLSVTGLPDNPDPADVINLSFGGAAPVCSPLEQSVIDEVVAAGSMVVVAAGNESGDVADYSPANCANVITVAALERSGALAWYSNTGANVALGAPGGGITGGIVTTHNAGAGSAGGDSYAGFAGTSFAAAQVSGAVSLMFSTQPGLSPAQVRQILRDTARPFPDASCDTALCGAGLLDVQAAVARAGGVTPAGRGGSSGGGGGGGCSVTAAQGAPDPLLPSLALAAWGMLWRRRRAGAPGRARRCNADCKPAHHVGRARRGGRCKGCPAVIGASGCTR